MGKFFAYVLMAITLGIIVHAFGNVEIKAQDIVNSLALIALWESCTHGEIESVYKAGK